MNRMSFECAVVLALMVVGCGGNSHSLATTAQSSPPTSVKVRALTSPTALTHQEVARALNVSPKDVVYVASDKRDTWALVISELYPPDRLNAQQSEDLADLEHSIVSRCGEGMACAVDVVGYDKACEIFSCKKFTLINVTRKDHPVFDVGTPHQLPRRQRSGLAFQDVDMDGQVEAVVSVGWDIDDPQALEDVLATYIIDTNTAGLQGAYIQKHKIETEASEGSPGRIEVLTQDAAFTEGQIDFVLSRATAEGYGCRFGADGMPVESDPDEDDNEECAIRTSQKKCSYDQEADNYRCEGQPMRIPTNLEQR